MEPLTRTATPGALRRISRWPAACVCGVLILTGCRDWTARATQRAARQGFDTYLVQGTRYQHQVFVRPASRGTALMVFIEGDGSPWSADGLHVSLDPTPRHPVALDLAALTPGMVLYVGRPCYFLAQADAACNATVWTAKRFSAEVAASMAAVVNRYCAELGSRHVTLIGYSGGGVLAVLMAPLIPSTSAVITIAANLDVDAWTRRHGYLTLAGSLNPATEAPLDPRIQQWHLVADRDQNVPPNLNARYWERIAVDRIWHFATFDHACCWASAWPDISIRLQAALADSGGDANDGWATD